MTMNTNQISMSNSATTIIVANTDRKKLLLKNTGTSNVFIGSDNSITASNAFPILTGSTFNCNDYTGIYYGICDTGETSTIEFIEEDL